MAVITLKSKYLQFTDEQFVLFCADQRDVKIERNAKGEILIMTPTFSDTGRYNSEINFQLMLWQRKSQSGPIFDSSTGFILPNGAMRSPDASWIEQSRWDALTEAQKKSFAPICPDFVVELRSASDHLPTLQEKMQEWIDNGAKLAWLIDVERKEVEVYQPRKDVQKVQSFDQNLSGAPVLSGFYLELPRLKS
ncbi:MAG TPA: hypothetical protein DCS93_01525 [Microscillaceae bacterium]|nr:hypothetical protein [Microscillaceae bacterium]